MTTFHEQMKHARENDDGRTIRDYPSWTLQDYRDFMFCVEKGYLVQDLSRGTLFMINEEWEGDDIYAEEFLEEEEDGLEQQLRDKIGAWLSDKTNHEGDLVDFLVDNCGVVIQEEEEVEKCIKCGTTEELRDYHLSWPRPSGIVKTCSVCAREMTKEFVESMYG